MEANYLRDKDFLLSLIKNKNKNIQIKLTALDFNENPIEFIEGRATGGSINVDGNSAVRRSCSISLVSQNLKLNNFLWALNTKFKLEIGLKNTVNDKYPDIIWFNQGIYLITSFSSSISENNLSISISGKDKMVLLNGEVSGHFGQSTILDVIEEENEEGAIKRTKLPIYNIILDMLQMYGNEHIYNIDINDLDNLGLKLVKYIGNSPIYIRQNAGTDEKGNLVPLTSNQDYTIENHLEEGLEMTEEGNINGNWVETGTDVNNMVFSIFGLDTEVENQIYFRKFDKINKKYEYFLLYQINYGDIMGYQATPLIFNDDLIAQPGETITSILDKIVNMLDKTYEYFYDINGRFIFQKKQDYVDFNWNPYEFYLNDTETSVKIQEDEFVFHFNDLELIKSINLSPQLNKVKNDFIVYGETENGYPLHLRYAIDKKPERYCSLQEQEETMENGKELKKKIVYVVKYSPEYENSLKVTPKNEDKLKIFEIKLQNQMFYPHKNGNYFSMSKKNFNSLEPLLAPNMAIKIDGKNYIIRKIESTILGRKRIYVNTKNQSELLGIKKITKYGNSTDETQQLSYIEKIVDWREIIYQMAIDFRKHGQDDHYIYNLQSLNPDLCSNGKTGYEQYYTDLLGFWPDLYRYKENIEDNENQVGWNLEQIKNIDSYFYWLDFIEGNQSFDAISVRQIGDRTLINNDKDVKCLFDRDIPPLLLYTGDQDPITTLTYTPIQLTEKEVNALSLASLPKSAKSVIDREISNNTVLSSSLSLTTIPIYYLEPNHKIIINTNSLGIQGQFLINSFTIPLSYNGMMNINVTEIVANLY